MNRNIQTMALTVLIGLFMVVLSHSSLGDPAGASILYNATEGTPSSTPASISTERGTITVLDLNAVQQDQQWKAYVGNVSGRLSLDDSNDFTIYDWELAGAITGEVYVTRDNSIDWSNVSCANATTISTEELFHNMTGTQSDSINNTYNYTNHDSFFVGSNQIANDTCPSTATYVNDAAQTIDGNQNFQVLILKDDDDGSAVYVTIISDDTAGYDNDNYDFQIIVPESDIKGTPTAYYFYTELS